MKRATLMIFLGIVFLAFGTLNVSAGNVWYSIWAGQTIVAGEVHVFTDGTNLKIDFHPLYGWKIAEYHIAVHTNKADIPTNKAGNPIPGQFQWADEFDPPEGDPDLITIPFSTINGGVSAGSPVYIAIHVVVVKTDSYGCIIQEETGWAGPCHLGWFPTDPLPAPFEKIGTNGWGYLFMFVL